MKDSSVHDISFMCGNSLPRDGIFHRLTSNSRLKLLPVVTTLFSLLCISSPAHALATASASLNNVYIEVVDLDLADGITAAVTFFSGYTRARADATPDGGTTRDTKDLFGAAGAAIGPLDASVAGASAAGAVIAGNLLSPGSGPAGVASVSASGANRDASAFGDAHISNFTLTPHSRLIVNATFSSASASTTVLNERSYAYSMVSLRANDDSHASYGSADSQCSNAGCSFTTGPRFLQASFDNLTGANAIGVIATQAYASATSAVPEPTISMLFAVGLMGVGLIGARRRRQ